MYPIYFLVPNLLKMKPDLPYGTIHTIHTKHKKMYANIEGITFLFPQNCKQFHNCIEIGSLDFFL